MVVYATIDCGGVWIGDGHRVHGRMWARCGFDGGGIEDGKEIGGGSRMDGDLDRQLSAKGVRRQPALHLYPIYVIQISMNFKTLKNPRGPLESLFTQNHI
jgi:hypothetical protein